MSISRRLLTLCVGIGLLASAATAACQPSPGAPANTRQILDNIQSANATVKTFSFSANASVTVEVTGGTSPGKMPMVMELTGQVDTVNKSMQMSGELSADIPGVGEQSLPLSVYIVDGWIYTKVQVANHGEQWVKVKLDDKQWASQDLLGQQMEFLGTAANVTLGQDENVDGVPSYVLSIDPDMKVLMEWVTRQQNAALDLTQLDLSKMFKSFSVRVWIAKATYLPVRANTQVTMEMSPEDVGATTEDFDKLALAMNMKYSFFDYNKPVTIVLPDAANSASEMPSAHGP